MGFVLVRGDVFAAVEPLVSPCREGYSATLRAEDVFRVLVQLRAAQSRSHPGFTRYQAWVAAAFYALGWPEPAARFVWESVALLGDAMPGGVSATAPRGDGEQAASPALGETLPATDLGCFLLLHCRAHGDVSAAAAADPGAAYSERAEAPGSPKYAQSSPPHSPPHAPNSPGSAPPPTSPRSATKALEDSSVDLCLRACHAAELRRVEGVKALLGVLVQLCGAFSGEAGDADHVSAVPQGDSDVVQNISARALDRLAFVLRVVPDASGNALKLSEAFRRASALPDGRLPVAAVVQWLRSVLRRDEAQAIIYDRHAIPPSTDDARTFVIADARRCTRLVADALKNAPGKPLRDVVIVRCRDARIYVLAAVRSVTIVDCVDCVVVVAAVARTARVVASERVGVVAACARFVAATVHDSWFSLYTPRAPLLLGDTRLCKLAPFCSAYPHLDDHLRQARLVPSAAGAKKWPNLWNAPLQVGHLARDANFVQLRGAEDLLLPPRAFELMHVPTCRGQEIPFALPPDYGAELDRRERCLAAVRQKVQVAKMSPQQREALEATAQIHFTKWLADSAQLRHIVELM